MKPSPCMGLELLKRHSWVNFGQPRILSRMRRRPTAPLFTGPDGPDAPLFHLCGSCAWVLVAGAKSPLFPHCSQWTREDK